MIRTKRIFNFRKKQAVFIYNCSFLPYKRFYHLYICKDVKCLTITLKISIKFFSDFKKACI